MKFLVALLVALCLISIVFGTHVKVDVEVGQSHHMRHHNSHENSESEPEMPVQEEEPQEQEEEEEEVGSNAPGCAALKGTCTTSCSGGTFHSGLCPGAANVKCCVKAAAPVASACSKIKGSCTTSCSGGTFHSGLCPGASNVKCCVKSAPAPAPKPKPTSAPKPTPTKYPSAACAAISGSCESSCSGGTFHSGLCPGPSNVRCCTKGVSHGNSACTIDTAALNLVKSFEGFVGHVYYDSVGVRTIGYGCTSACSGITSITEPEAAAKLSSMLQNSYGSCVRDRVTHPLTLNQYGALTSFVYNLGCGVLEGNLLSYLNSGNFAAAENDMLQYDHAGGVVLAGLSRRRQAEVALMKKKSAKC